MTFDKNYKILKNYKNKKVFLFFSRKSLFDSIKEICKEDLAIKIRNKGYNKMHHYFPVDYLPFLNFYLKKTEKYIYNFIANTAYEDLKMKNLFILIRSQIIGFIILLQLQKNLDYLDQYLDY